MKNIPDGGLGLPNPQLVLLCQYCESLLNDDIKAIWLPYTRGHLVLCLFHLFVPVVNVVTN